MGGKVKILVMGGIILMLAFLISFVIAIRIFVTGFPKPAPSQTLVWDLRKGPSRIEEVNWPASVTGDTWDQKGLFDLTIINYDGKVFFHENVQHIICDRKGNERIATYLHFNPGCTSEEAYRITKKIMRDWDRPPGVFSDLDAWHEGIIKRMSIGDFIQLHKKDHFYANAALIYPCFETEGMRISDTGGSVTDGNATFTLSLTF